MKRSQDKADVNAEEVDMPLELVMKVDGKVAPSCVVPTEIIIKVLRNTKGMKDGDEVIAKERPHIVSVSGAKRAPDGVVVEDISEPPEEAPGPKRARGSGGGRGRARSSRGR